MIETPKSNLEALGELLNESKMQVTFTGWKAELEQVELLLKEAIGIIQSNDSNHWCMDHNESCEICNFEKKCQDLRAKGFKI